MNKKGLLIAVLTNSPANEVPFYHIFTVCYAIL